MTASPFGLGGGFGAPPPSFSGDFSEAEYDRARYVWMRETHTLDTTIRRFMRHFVEDLRAAVVRWARLAIVALAPANTLDAHGLTRAMALWPDEPPDSYRRRLMDAFNWKRFTGWLLGPYRAFEYFGVTADGIHTYAVPYALWTALSWQSTAIEEGGAVGLQWLIQRADALSAVTYNYWDGAAWQTTALTQANILAHGNTAAELEAIAAADWSLLLPCEAAFVTWLEGDNFSLYHPGIIIDVTAEFIG